MRNNLYQFLLYTHAFAFVLLLPAIIVTRFRESLSWTLATSLLVLFISAVAILAVFRKTLAGWEKVYFALYFILTLIGLAYMGMWLLVLLAGER